MFHYFPMYGVQIAFKDFKVGHTILESEWVGFKHFQQFLSSYKFIDVLKNISFTINKGESLGVIGHNGAGKSTLLRIVAGVYHPSEGRVATKGTTVLLNLGAGFDPEASGEENIYLNGI